MFELPGNGDVKNQEPEIPGPLNVQRLFVRRFMNDDSVCAGSSFAAMQEQFGPEHEHE